MAIKVPNEGERNLLTALEYGIVSFGTPANIHLYKNDLTPDDDTEFADFTEADFSGYGASSLSGGAVDPAPDGGGRAVCTWSDEVFTHNGGGTANTVYGYYVTNNGNNELLWCERFANPITFAVADDAVTIRPKLTIKSEV